jgi:hypothetical protein
LLNVGTGYDEVRAMVAERSAKYCRVCLLHLRPDGRCIYKCDPAMSGTARRRVARERRLAREREVKRESRFDRRPRR